MMHKNKSPGRITLEQTTPVVDCYQRMNREMKMKMKTCPLTRLLAASLTMIFAIACGPSDREISEARAAAEETFEESGLNGPRTIAYKLTAVKDGEATVTQEGVMRFDAFDCGGASIRSKWAIGGELEQIICSAEWKSTDHDIEPTSAWFSDETWLNVYIDVESGEIDSVDLSKLLLSKPRPPQGSTDTQAACEHVYRGGASEALSGTSECDLIGLEGAITELRLEFEEITDVTEGM